MTDFEKSKRLSLWPVGRPWHTAGMQTCRIEEISLGLGVIQYVLAIRHADGSDRLTITYKLKSEAEAAQAEFARNQAKGRSWP